MALVMDKRKGLHLVVVDDVFDMMWLVVVVVMNSLVGENVKAL